MVSPSLAEMQMALDPALPGLALDPALPGLALDPALPGLALGLALDPAPLGPAPSWSASPQAQEAARRMGALVEEVSSAMRWPRPALRSRSSRARPAPARPPAASAWLPNSQPRPSTTFRRAMPRGATA